MNPKTDWDNQEPCPTCEAATGDPCISSRGGYLFYPHPPRKMIVRPLSPMELAIVSLVADGLSTADIVRTKNLTRYSVWSALMRARNKLGTRNGREELVREARRRGLIEAAPPTLD